MDLLNADLGEMNLSTVSLMQDAIRKNMQSRGFLAGECFSDNIVVRD